MNRFMVRRTPPRNATEARSLVPYVEILASAGETSLTANLMTEKEVDEAIDGLIAQLQQLRKEAKAELK